MGPMPARLTRPTVGFSPTIPDIDAGLTIDPSVSVPIAKAARFVDTATAEPELEPLGLRSSAYGLRVNPPVALHPLIDQEERILAHSLRLVLPKRTAPARRRRATISASCVGGGLTRASEPAVVRVRPAVSMLSLTSMGMPCSGLRGPRTRRSSSSFCA